MKIKTLSSCIITFVFAIFAFCGCSRPETYIVTFNANGGYGTMQQQVFTEGEQQALTRNAFSRDGYSFSGWNGNGANYIDGQMITVTANMTLYAQWTSNSGQQGGGSQGGSGEGGGPTNGQINGHAYVDLGLPSGTLWATCNVGANIPSGTGYYYAWGETSPKSQYTSDNYTYTDNPDILPASADAAAVNWGGGWRMPTVDEAEELLACNQTETIENNIKGVLITGYNGNTLFLPYCCGYIDYVFCGGYWTSTGFPEYNNYAGCIEIDCEDDCEAYSDGEARRYQGLVIRPVYSTGNSTPMVTTGGAVYDGESYTRLRFRGNVTSYGANAVTERGFFWGTDANNLSQTVIAEGSGTGEFAATVSGLTEGTTYYYKAYATNNIGTGYGEVRSYTTGETSIPVVHTNNATNITNSGATIHAYVDVDYYGDAVTSCGFLFGTSENNLSQNIQSDGYYFNATLTGLTPSTTYYYKAYATNSAGTGYGEVKSFTTAMADAPTVTTEPATNITSNSANLSGNVTSDGGAPITARGFVYGTGNNNLSQTIQSANGTGNYTATLTNLDYNTRYYYKAYATNSTSTSYGEIMSFVTSATIPTVHTIAMDNTPSSLSFEANYASIRGEVISDGGATVTNKGFLYGTNASNLSQDVHADGGVNFYKTIGDLIPGTTYYYKAYATNIIGTAYGEVMSFTTITYNQPTGYVNGHGYVDLGLPSGTKWATCNLGATIPEGYGNYYAWGESGTKSVYSLDTYIYYDGSSYTKYNNSDNLSVLEATDDAATVNWGNGWRMPTHDEIEELRYYCNIFYGNKDGVIGNFIVGPNGNCIFMTAAGRSDGTTSGGIGTRGFYWSSSIDYHYSPRDAYYLDFTTQGVSANVYNSRRYIGMPVRPVCSSR